MTPELITARLVLRPYYAGMVSREHVAWLNDPEVVRYSEQRHKKHTLESTHAYVNELRHAPDAHLWGIWALAFSDLDPEACNAIQPTLIGTISAHIDAPNQIANLGIMVGHRAFWGFGFGLEAWLAVSNWCFETGIRKIEMGCHFKNRAMRKTAERAGMVMEGVRHDHFVVNGEPQHLMLYAKMKPERAKVAINEYGQNILGQPSEDARDGQPGNSPRLLLSRS